MFTGLTEQLDFGNHLIAEMIPNGHDLCLASIKWEFLLVKLS